MYNNEKKKKKEKEKQKERKNMKKINRWLIERNKKDSKF